MGDLRSRSNMDLLTQGVLGATLAGSAASKGLKRQALLAGFIGGMTADLDVFIRSDADPLLNIQYHRHFTHAPVFIPIGGLLTSLALFFIPWLIRQWVLLLANWVRRPSAQRNCCGIEAAWGNG